MVEPCNRNQCLTENYHVPPHHVLPTVIEESSAHDNATHVRQAQDMFSSLSAGSTDVFAASECSAREKGNDDGALQLAGSNQKDPESLNTADGDKAIKKQVGKMDTAVKTKHVGGQAKSKGGGAHKDGGGAKSKGNKGFGGKSKDSEMTMR